MVTVNTIKIRKTKKGHLVHFVYIYKYTLPFLREVKNKSNNRFPKDDFSTYLGGFLLELRKVRSVVDCYKNKHIKKYIKIPTIGLFFLYIFLLKIFLML